MDTLITILIIVIILVGFLSTVRVTELSILPIIVTILLGVACISIELAAFACQIAGSDGAADRAHDPRTPDHERRSYGGGRGSSGCRDPRINRKLPQCERGRPAQDRPRFICIRPSRSNR